MNVSSVKKHRVQWNEWHTLFKFQIHGCSVQNKAAIGTNIYI